MTLDPTTPVIIGASVVCNRTDRGATPRGVVDLLAQATVGAADDSGAGADVVLGALRVARSALVVTHRLGDPAGLTVAALGLGGVESERWQGGGELCGSMLAHTAGEVAGGAPGVTLLLAGEAWYSHLAAERGTGPVLARPPEADREPTRTVGRLIDFIDPAEEAVGLDQPIMQYPMLENAIRAREGRTVSEHRAFLGRLSAGFSAVAVRNPSAWDRNPHTAEDIAEPSPANRHVGLPYTKLMVSNERVDQAAALLVCSVAEAERLGVPRDRWVFPWLTVSGAAPTMTQRIDLSRSAMADVVGRTLWSAAGLDGDDVAHVDLYSCFPSAVQQQAAGYRLGPDRTLTVTGGMRFAGGPWNGYPMHGLARMAEVLRRDPGTVGLCSANGGAVTKLAATLLSTEPFAEPFRWLKPDEELGALPRRRAAVVAAGSTIDAPVETYTVMHDGRGRPTVGFVAVAPDDSTRGWGRVDDPVTVAAMATEEVLGRPARVAADGTASLA